MKWSAKIGLLAVSFMLIQAAPSSAMEPEQLVKKKAAILNLLHRKAQKALVTAAQDKEFSKYFHAHSDEERHSHKTKIDKISLKVQSRFHVEEMCVINPEGEELSRIVGNEIAHDLATDESSASFFAPGFAQPAKKTYVSPIYLSPDADKWVVAYVTPILVEGEKRAILHYEHGLDVYQEAVSKGLDGEDTYLLVVDAQGLVLSDSRQGIAVDRIEGKEEEGQYFSALELAGHDWSGVVARLGDGETGEGVLEGPEGAMKVAFHKVQDWFLVAVAPPA